MENPKDMFGLRLKYFVLKPEGDDAYAHASREAIKAYANAIESENELLASDLMKWRMQLLIELHRDGKIDW